MSFAEVSPSLDHCLQLNDKDNVAIAKVNLSSGTIVRVKKKSITVLQAVPAGHKIALEDIPVNSPVFRYGQFIGVSKQAIKQGEHVHTHNLKMVPFARDTIPGREIKPFPGISENEQRTFMGYPRINGQAGTRNYIAVISTVNCSAHVTQQIARYFTEERLSKYPEIDGVVPFTHPYGCGVDIGGENYQLLQRTLAGIALHPNVGGYLVVGLGCETNQAADLIENYHMTSDPVLSPPPLIIQELGGVRKTLDAGIAAVERMLLAVNAIQRIPTSLDQLCVALQCGGSDGWSGVTANPVVGLAADKIVQQGGTVVLGETPEIFGAEHLLTNRAVTQETAELLLQQVEWWEKHTNQLGASMDQNRSPGNAAGGLTTIYEKALGAVAKGGSTPLMDVYEYAEKVTSKGLVFMNTPGNDAISVTGQVAGGCNLALFTTGRGSAFGFKPAPSIKISTNTTLYDRMPDDMDMNAGKVLDGGSLEDLAEELFELVIATASGQPSNSEALGIGEAEFSPWFLGGVL